MTFAWFTTEVRIASIKCAPSKSNVPPSMEAVEGRLYDRGSNLIFWILILKLKCFIDPSDPNQLYHTPILYKIWDWNNGIFLVNNPFLKWYGLFSGGEKWRCPGHSPSWHAEADGALPKQGGQSLQIQRWDGPLEGLNFSQYMLFNMFSNAGSVYFSSWWFPE